MHKWHLLLFAFLAVCKPSVTFGEHSLADGQQQCCNRHSSFLLRDTRLSLHDSNRYIKSVDEDRRINLKALREIRRYDQEPRKHSIAKITAKDKHNLISLQLNDRNIQQPFKNTKGKWNYEIARESIFGVHGSRQNQNQGTRLAVYYNRDTHRSHSSNLQEVRDVTHKLHQGAKNDAARPNRNVQRTIEYKLNGLRSVKSSEPRFDTNRESLVNSKMSRDIRETTEIGDQEARKGVVQSYRNLKTVENKVHGMRRIKHSEPRFNTNREHRANSRISREIRGTTETRDQVTRNDAARPYSNAQRTVEYRLDRLRRVARSEPRLDTTREIRVNSIISRDVRGTTETRDQVTRDDVARSYSNAQRKVEYRLDRLRRVVRSAPRLDTTRESRVNSKKSRDFREITEIRDQTARNVIRSYRKVQLNVENRLNSFRSDTSFKLRLNTNREHREDSRIAQDVSKTAETRDHEARNDVVRSYRNVPLMVENRVIQVTRSKPRYDINHNYSSLKYTRKVTGPKETRDLLQARNVIIRSHENVRRTVKSMLNGLTRVSGSETRLEDNRERRIRAVRVFENESEHPITISRNRNFAETAYYRVNSQHQYSFRTEAREKRQEEVQQRFFEQKVQRLSPSVLKIDNNRVLSRFNSENLWKLSNGRIDEQRYKREENTIRARQEVRQTIENRRSIRSPVILRNRLRITSKHRRNHQIKQNRDENGNQSISLKQTQYTIVYQRPVLLGLKNNRVQTRVGSSNIRTKTERIQVRSSQKSERNDDKERPSDGRIKITANIYRRPSLSGGPNLVLYSRERSANIRSGLRQQNNVRMYRNRQLSNNERVQRFRNVRSITDDDRRLLSVNPNNPILNRAPNVRNLENITPKYNRKSNQHAKNNERVHHSELTNRNVILQNDAGRWNVRNYLKNEAVNNGHRIIAYYTERSFDTRGLVRDENRQDQRSREYTSSNYRNNMRQTLLQERGVQVRNTLPKASDVQVYNDRDSEIKKQKENSKKETATANWQYIFYTIQGLYVCAILIHMGTEDKLRKTKKGYLGLWKSSKDTLKVD